MRKALYGGSFDPVTHGHVSLILKALKLFDELVIVIGDNPDKKYLFSRADRFAMIWGAIRPLVDDHARVKVQYSGNRLLASIAEQNDCSFLVRGVRSVSDCEYEKSMRNINYQIVPGLETVFLMPHRDLADVSSSAVRGMVGLQGWETIVSTMVPDSTLRCLKGLLDVDPSSDEA